MNPAKTMPAARGGYFGLYWSEKMDRYVKVAPSNAYSFATAPEALRAARHREGNPMTMTAACPLPSPEPDFDAHGINKWRRRRAEERAGLELGTFGSIKIRGREVVVEKRVRKQKESE